MTACTSSYLELLSDWSFGLFILGICFCSALGKRWGGRDD
jgi:hypothetical protein